ncbi:uncharacterized protein LOC119578873 [Penaeus monodon]|uniref:uncharacterized protein LOC119578873 n=1 Tax=Penaeus monodon TaxID=6687 RepID=UPI0018A7ACF0|nr:uncharacterized protein LOC119578873 [Penaeus monodon]
MNWHGPSLNMLLLWVMLLPLVVPGLGLAPSTLISQVSLSQLLEEVSKLMQTHKILNSSEESTQQKIVPSSACTDDPQTEDCSKVVENDLCIANLFYARYCCRSCTLAGKIPVFGPHLDQKAEAELEVKITSDKKRYLRGSDITVTCFATGYPAPEIFWLQDDSEISSERKHQENVTDLGGILSRTIRNDLIVRNYTRGDSVKFKCIAINPVGINSAQTELRIDNAEINTYPNQAFFKSSQEAVVTCVIRGTNLGNLTWNLGYSLRREPHTVVENRWEENGMTVIQSNVTIHAAQLSTIPKTYDIKCSSTNKTYRDLGELKRVYIVKDVEIPSNCTDSNSEKCYENRRNCNDLMQAFCCKTCTLMNNAQMSYPYDSSKDYMSVSTYGQASAGYGGKVTIKCFSTCSFGKQDVKWYKDGEEINDSYGYYIKDEFQLELFLWQGISVLTISNVKVKDIGRYTCRATHGQRTDADYVTVRFNNYGNLDYM